MLVVKIEVWPGGAVTRAHEIGRVFVGNVSDLADTSRYYVEGDFSGAPHLGIKPYFGDFIIEEHERKQPVSALLEKVFTEFTQLQKTDN